jgi:formyl-CoA transferase
MYDACGVESAVHELDRTGLGRVVRSSLLAVMLGGHAFRGTRYTR